MTETSPKLSTTARTVLTVAAARNDHLVHLPQLPVAAARQVVRSLLNGGLVEEIPAPVEFADFAWRTAEDGAALMLRATAAGLARVGEPEAAHAVPGPDDDGEAAEASASARPASDASDTSTPSGSIAEGNEAADVANGGKRNEDGPIATIQVDAGIAPLVNAFVRELMKQERAPYVTAFPRRLDCGAVRGTAATGTKRAREMSASQRKIVELCGRLEGATGKELAEGCGWPSIAARATCQKIADRFGYVLHESPKANGRGISFRLTAKQVVEG